MSDSVGQSLAAYTENNKMVVGLHSNAIVCERWFTYPKLCITVNYS